MKVVPLQAIDDRSQIERRYPPGLSYLASYLGKHGGIDQIVFRRSPQDLIAEKPGSCWHFVCHYNFNRAIRSAKEIIDSLGVPAVVGGAHISELSQTVNALSREIAQLRETVEGFKRGRIMKVLMGAQDFGRRLVLGRPTEGAGAP